jgi:hypothetical protein
MINKLILLILVSILGIYAACAWSPAPVVVAPLVHEHSATHNRSVDALAALNALDVHCPAFLDAPLGIKPCPAQDLLDHTKATIQAQIDSTY